MEGIFNRGMSHGYRVYCLGATEEEYAERIRVYSFGQWVVELAGETVAVAASQRITEKFLSSTPIRFDALTDNGRFTRSHDPAGEILHLVSVSVPPGVRGLGLGRRLVDHEMAAARNLNDVKRIIGITRPRGFKRRAGMSIEEYVSARTENGSHLDPVMSFHLGAGARLVSIHAGYRPGDEDSRGYGVMIEYDLHEQGP